MRPNPYCSSSGASTNARRTFALDLLTSMYRSLHRGLTADKRWICAGPTRSDVRGRQWSARGRQLRPRKAPAGPAPLLAVVVVVGLSGVERGLECFRIPPECRSASPGPRLVREMIRRDEERSGLSEMESPR